MNQLGSKDSSRDLQANYAFSFFYLYLILYACAERFGAIGNLKKFLVFKVNKTFVTILVAVSGEAHVFDSAYRDLREFRVATTSSGRSRSFLPVASGASMSALHMYPYSSPIHAL